MSILLGAALQRFASQAHRSKPVTLWQYSDYVSPNESYRPLITGFVAAANQDGNAKETLLDSEGNAKLPPQICNRNPQIARRDSLVQANNKSIKQDRAFSGNRVFSGKNRD